MNGKKVNETDPSIEYAVSVLSEMKRNLDNMHVCATYTRQAVITTSANLCGDHHDYVCWKVLGIPMVEDLMCSSPECGEREDLYECEGCGKRFCAEHGQRGGDRQVQDVGAVAYPSLCDTCRGLD